MKKIFILFLLLLSIVIYSQSTTKNIEYINMTSFSISKNTESKFSNFRRDSVKTFNGLALDVNTIHGAKLFGYVAISAGLSVDWNINKTFLSTPVFADLRIFSSRNIENCLFFYLQTGQNIKFTKNSDGNGTSSRLGVGYIFDSYGNTSYYCDFYKKSKQIYLRDKEEFGYYDINGYGISFGIIF